MSLVNLSNYNTFYCNFLTLNYQNNFIDKPVPSWAKEPYLSQKAQTQSSLMVNFTRLFRSSCQQEVILENIFRVKRKKFTERSSSANWSSPPLWRTNGLTGEESFRKFHKNF